MNHYPRHIGDYLKDTSHLSLLEHGVYTRLLDVYYTREAPIPAEQVERLVGARTREEKAALQAVLSEFFTPSPEGWRQARADRELERYREKAERNRQIGKLGGRPKTQTEPRNNPDGFQKETQTEPTDNPSHKPIANSQEPKKKEQSASQGSRLPADWALPEEWKAAAQSIRAEWSSENIDFVAEKFRDYWHSKPGAAGRKIDWLATWRNWCREEKTQGTKKRETLAELLAREEQEAANAGN